MKFIGRRAIFCFFLRLSAFACLESALNAQVLLSSVSPTTAQPGLTNVSVTGSGFPSVAIAAANISVSLAPATPGVGPTASVAASSIATVLGTIRRVTFLVPANLTVTTPTPYLISISDTTDGFSSTNQAALTINPAAAISSISPNGVIQGQSATVTITGQYSNFLQGLTAVSAGAGIAVSNVVVTSPTSLAASFAVDPNAVPGARTVTAASGSEIALLAGGFTVNPGNALLTSVNPPSGQQGQSVSIAVAGNSTNFSAGTTTATLGPDVTVTGVTVTDSTHAMINATINPTAVVGPRTLTIATGSSIATSAFSIISGPALISSVNVNSASQGQVVPVTVTGNSTHFANGTTTADFGQGVTIAAVTVGTATSATVSLSVQDNALAGARTVTLTTGGEIATLANGFTVSPSPPLILSLSPNSGTQGQVISGVAITGRFTHFINSTTTASFGPGIIVNSLSVIDPTHATANISVDPLATIGPRDLTLTTATESVTLSGGFTVRPGLATISSVSPAAGQQGQSLTGVVVTGTATHFTSGTPIVSFSNPGVTASNLVVLDNAHLTVSLTIAPSASTGVFNVTVATGGETALGAGLFTVSAPVPTLQSVNPNSGQQGQTLSGVLFTGSFTHFTQGTPAVTFSNPGVSASNVQVTDNNHLTATITIAASATLGTSNVTIVTGSEIAIGTGLFTVGSGAPALTSVTPASGQQGQTLTGVLITGSFTHFTQGAPAVTFSTPGVTASNVQVADNTHLTATITITPSATAGASNVSVVTGSENATGAILFTVTPGTPTISSVAPSAGPQGQILPGVVITGAFTHFTQGNPVVTFSNAGVVASSISVSDNTHLTATLSIAANSTTGPSNLTVVTGAESAVGTGLFTVGSGIPTITSVTPASGQQGQVLTGVAITGAFTHFTQGTPTLTFSNPGVTATNVSLIDNTHLMATIAIAANAATGLSNVSVMTGSENAGGTALFSVTAGTPTITSVAPPAGTQGQTLTGVVITGAFTHFSQGTSTVTFSNAGVTASNIQVTDNTHLTATVTIAGTAASGASNVTVVTSGETATGTSLFTVTNGTPVITQLSPNTGQQGQVLTGVVITGAFTHFSQGTPAVTFSNAGVTVSNIQVTDNTHLTATVTIAGTAASGASNVTVVTGSESAIGTSLFTVTNGTPVITQVNPNTGQQGQVLTGVVITGAFTHFSQGTPTVTFSNAGVTASNVQVNDNTHLTVTITITGAATSGASNVTVVTGTENAIGNALFNLTPATPAITSVAPAAGQQGQVLTGVLITGAFTHFTQGTPMVTFSTAGVNASSISVTDNTHVTVTVTIAANAVTGPANVTVATGTETAVGTALFTVGNGTPSITSLSPATGQQGQTLTGISVTGAFTHFTQGTPTLTFSNAGVIASNIVVTDNTHLTATLTIGPTAAVGASNVSVATGTETANGTGLFTVNPGSPVIMSIAPAAGQQGQTLTGVVITGAFTHFAQGAPAVTFSSAGVTATNVIVTDGTHLTATVTIAANAAPGASNVTVVTGTETATGAGLFTVGSGATVITGVTPASGIQGQILTGVLITGAFTHFSQSTPSVTFSNQGVTASAVQVTDNTHLTVTLTIAANATTGLSNVTVVTGSESAAGTALFTIISGTSMITNLLPGTGQQGQTLTGVVITGAFTHFTLGVPVVTFSNTGVTANNVAVTDNTHLTVKVTTASTAAVGVSNVMVVTGAESAIGQGLFTVTAGTPIITSVFPATGQQGQQNLSVSIIGQFTHFVQGTTTANFGANITVVSLAVNSATNATAVINLDPGAAPGTRGVTLTTNTEMTTLANAFSITAGVPSINITSPTNLSYLNISPTTVNGTVSDSSATVVINGITAVVGNGSFSQAVPLAEGPNIITATATTAGGLAGTASIQVTLDTTPPHVTITSPPDQFVTTDASATISGSVNDIVVGTVNDQQVQVTVNGIAAQVANRTFLATSIPLSMGSNVIQAVGRDRAGNAATTQITVIRQAPAAQPQITLISGNNQSATISSVLPAPLVVSLKDASGNPVANQQVIFKVDQNNGMVSTGGTPASAVVATTNAQGQAQAQWTLGGRAGAGGNTVEAYAVGFNGTAFFSATGTQGSAAMVVIDSGNNQIGAINQPLPRPLIAVVVDQGKNRLPNVPITFTVKQGGGNFGGQSSITVTSDSDGRAAATLTLGLQEGNSNNLVEAGTATFTASGRAEGKPANTVISGVVLDNSNIPISGVTIRAVLTNLATSSSGAIPAAVTVGTNAQGQFSIPNAPIGFVKLLVDGTTAGNYPTLDYDMVTIAGQTNTLGMPIYLLPLTSVNQLCVTASTGGGTLTMPEAPGFSLTFGPGQVTFPGGSKTGCVSVTVVHGDKVPMVPGFGQQPRFIVTIQPSGALFNPPAPITLPNVDGLAPRAVTEMYSFDHDIGSFVAIGTGAVSDDGQVIRSSAGVGVLKAGWHCGGDSNTSATVADCPTCMHCTNNTCVPDQNQNNQACGNACIVGGQGNCANGACSGGTAVNCDDGNVCNGTETCDPVLGCQAGTPLHCDDGNVCNGTETCDPTRGCLAGTPLHCDDGNVCNGVETCDPTLGCTAGTPLNCSSGNPCLTDGCDPSAGCNHVDNQQCQQACDGKPQGASCTVGGVTGVCDANKNCNLCGTLGANATCTCGSGAVGLCDGSGKCSCSGTPTITLVTPNQGQQGQTDMVVTITGLNTSFAQGSSQVDFGPDVTVNATFVQSPTSLAADISISSTANPGARTVNVITGSEVAGLPNGFTVLSCQLQILSGTPTPLSTVTAKVVGSRLALGPNLSGGFCPTSLSLSPGSMLPLSVGACSGGTCPVPSTLQWSLSPAAAAYLSLIDQGTTAQLSVPAGTPFGQIGSVILQKIVGNVLTKIDEKVIQIVGAQIGVRISNKTYTSIGSLSLLEAGPVSRSVAGTIDHLFTQPTLVNLINCPPNVDCSGLPETVTATWFEISPFSRLCLNSPSHCVVSKVCTFPPQGQSTLCDLELDLDSSSPSITYTLTPSSSHTDPQGNKWLNAQDLAGTSNIRADFVCSDPDDTPGTADSVKSCPGELPIPVSEGKGQMFRSGQGSDLAGNTRTVPVVVNVDTVLPTIPLPPSISPSPNVNGWNNTNVSLTFTATDSGSMIDPSRSKIEIDGLQSNGLSGIISGEGTHNIRGIAVDYAGNMKISDFQVVKIDTSPPSFTNIVPPDGSVITNSTVQITGTLTDNLSGVDTHSVSCTFATTTVAASVSGNGFTCQPLTFLPGPNRVLIGAKDLAGNSALVTLTLNF